MLINKIYKGVFNMSTPELSPIANSHLIRGESPREKTESNCMGHCFKKMCDCIANLPWKEIAAIALIALGIVLIAASICSLVGVPFAVAGCVAIGLTGSSIMWAGATGAVLGMISVIGGMCLLAGKDKPHRDQNHDVSSETTPKGESRSYSQSPRGSVQRPSPLNVENLDDEFAEHEEVAKGVAASKPGQGPQPTAETAIHPINAFYAVAEFVPIDALGTCLDEGPIDPSVKPKSTESDAAGDTQNKILKIISAN
jgi:hypothetical protein